MDNRIFLKKEDDLIIKNECKRRVACNLVENAVLKGTILAECILNSETDVFGIELDSEVETGTDGIFEDKFVFSCKNDCGILLKASADHIDIDEETGFVKGHSVSDIKNEKGQFEIGDTVKIECNGKILRGIIKHSGKIKNIFCYAIKLSQDSSYPGVDDSNLCIVIENEVVEDLDLVSVTYVWPRYSIPFGDNKGIQGNLNSCYLDTSLFAIFTFNMFLDNMLVSKMDDENINELQYILRSEIVYPLRRLGYVTYKAVSKFRDKLQSLSPGGKFVINERDPEELFEQLFQLLTPKNYLLRTRSIQNIESEQKCFLTQLFYQTIPEKTHINLLDMFTMTFLEFEMLIDMPPKCLILQLPRDGRELKQFKRVSIPSKLDITPFIIHCSKPCKDCSLDGIYLCQCCSKSRVEMTYYCQTHTTNCQHKKQPITTENKFHGKVVLDLVSILCIEKTHYVTFVKTNEVREKWVYFNSMENIDNGRFIPLVRDTNLHKYFSITDEERLRLEYDKDVEKIENYAFVIIYKNPTMEFYSRDFNSD